MTDLNELNQRVSAAKAEVEARGETFYPGASRVHLASFPPKERWNDWHVSVQAKRGQRSSQFVCYGVGELSAPLG